MREIFVRSDIERLAGKAGLAIRENASHINLASAMNAALFNAHAAGLISRNVPAPGEMRDAIDGVIAKGRELLLALGFDHSPEAIAAMDVTSVARASGIMYALMRHKPVVEALPSGVLAAYGHVDDQEADRSCLAGQRYFIEAARAVSFMMIHAESARPRAVRSGPSKDFFTPTLLDGLAQAYFSTFGAWPATLREAERDFGNPSLLWLDHALRTAADRIPRSSLTCGQELACRLDTLMAAELETRSRYFVSAGVRMRTAKPRKG